MVDEMDFKDWKFWWDSIIKNIKIDCGTIKHENKNMVKILKLMILNLPKCNFIKIDVELMEIDV